MAITGISGPSSGLAQFLASLATSGTSPSRPVGWAGLAGTVPDQPTDDNAGSPGNVNASAPAEGRPRQLLSLIQATVNALTSDRTGNPLDALNSIESTPGLGGLLGQLNVSPQQFRSDILSAMSQSSDGNPDLSQVFQSFPAGQNLNTLA